ncbi:MAG: TonB-dependent receptor [Phenylobacterium sp.]|uniref:TonB-dependent receptor n=1 Tax=Phenylobacterium sp. TaxID=1871053 RepID=UPI0025E3E366|nr:TonB-dependent receptor [Phenylobacterium sp.]MBI1198519.1 TonB-dependent receptor [Phenylobacterium sp.]
MDTRLLTGAALGVLCVAAVAQPAIAEGVEDATQLDELVVTARRREESLKDVPASVSAITSESITRRGGIRDVTDLSYMLPGVGLANTHTINAENNIRGAGAGTTRTNNADSPVAVLRDGASITGGNLGGRVYTRADLFDLQRVEVIRGPQGSLYGVNAVGGVMQAISTRPRPDLGGSIRASYSPKIERTQIDAIGNLPITDTLAMRFGVQVVDKDKGYFFNKVTDSYGDKEKYQGFRASALWTPSDRISVFTVYDRSDERSSSNFVNTTSQVNDVTIPASQIYPADTDGPFVYANNASNDVNRDVSNWLTEIKVDLGAGKLTSTSLYRLRDTNWSQDADRSAPGFGPVFPASCGTQSCSLYFYDRTKIESEDLRYQWPLTDRIDMQVGGNATYKQSLGNFISDGRTVSATNLNPSAVANTASVGNETEHSWGVFASASVRVTDRLTVDAAARYGEAHKDFLSYVTNRQVGAVLCPYETPFDALDVGGVCTAGLARLSDTFTSFTPSVSVRYAIAPDFRVFASVAKGDRAGGFNGNTGFDAGIPATFEPETTLAYEAGAKWELLHTAFSASAFYNDYRKLLVGQVNFGPDLVPRSYRLNAGDAHTQGVDFEAFGSASWPDGGLLSYSLGVNYIHGKVDNGPYKGLTVENIPEWMVTASLYYERPLFADWRGFASLNYRGEQGGYTGFIGFNNQVSAARINLFRGGVGVTNDALRFELSAENLFNDTYEAIRDTNRSIWGDRREVRFTMSYALGSERRAR